MWMQARGYSYRAKKYPVKISLLGVKFESKTAGVSNTVCRAFLSSNS